jgi:hypothetical protein
MNAAIAGLMSGFLLLCALVLVLMIKTRLALGWKVFALVALTLFYWVQYFALQRYAGWPVQQALPSEFVLIASEVIEPDRSTGDPGRMYWWVRESADPSVPPRLYQLPYVQTVHRQSAEVLQAQQQGSQFVGRQVGSFQGDADLGIEFEQVSKSAHYQKQ